MGNTRKYSVPTRDGRSNTPAYGTWSVLKHRAKKKGIEFHEPWLDFEVFNKFYEDNTLGEGSCLIQLDKSINSYDPDNMVFIPSEIRNNISAFSRPIRVEKMYNRYLIRRQSGSARIPCDTFEDAVEWKKAERRRSLESIKHLFVDERMYPLYSKLIEESEIAYQESKFHIEYF